MGRLSGKVAMVTGGALGIGQGTAELFGSEGAKVVVADLDERAGTAVVAGILDRGGAASFVALDVSSEESWQHAIAETLRQYGKLNILVNNAGICLPGDVETTTLSEWDRTMRVNATGVFLGMKCAVEAMKSNGELCSIINRSSILGQVAEPGILAYCASKGAVTVMSKSAAIELGRKSYKIRVNSVHPGYVKTPLGEEAGREEADRLGIEWGEYLSQLDAGQPLGFRGEPIDIAYLDVYLASDESRWVTGAEFTIDGGRTAG